MNRVLSVVVAIAFLVAGTTTMAEAAVYPEIVIAIYVEEVAGRMILERES